MFLFCFQGKAAIQELKHYSAAIHVHSRFSNGEYEVSERAGFHVLERKGFNRVGGLGGRISGKILRKKTLSVGQMRLFELGCH